jgi:hypothetical protein
MWPCRRETKKAGICDECKDDFNKSYYLQIVSEYNLLTPEEKKLNQSAAKVIDDIISKIKDHQFHPICDDIFSIEKALIQLQTTEKIRLERDALRDKYHDVVGADRYAHYAAEAKRIEDTATSTNKPDTIRESLLSDVNFLMAELHLKYTLLPFRENERKPLIKNIGGTIIAFYMLIFVLRVFWQFNYGIILIMLLMALGSTGAYISMIIRLHEIPLFNDPVVNFLSLKYGRLSVYLNPVTGAIFAVILYFILVGGMISGTIFPAIKCGADKFYLTPPLSGCENYAKLFVWAFISGFAERFVPDTLDRLIVLKGKSSDKPPKSPP